MTKSNDASSVNDRSVAVVEAFVIRARRVAAHSLASEALRDLSRGLFTVTPEPDGLTRIQTKFPPEEQMESLAARVRPVILDRDPIYLQKVLNALSYLVRQRPDYMAVCQQLKDRWREIDPRDGQLAGYLVQHVDTSEGTSSTASDSVLALAWLYGDVVHADTERQASAGSISIDERYRSAAHLVSRIAVLLLDTFGFIMYLRKEGVVELRDSVFKQPVVVKEPNRNELGRLWMAPVGTDVPDVGAPFGAGWSQVVHEPNPSPDDEGSTS
ncbi:hypothetical protein EV651_1392 [Kribbella sp. VKM Ac-2571]|uniref:hypothetical protein n=1 Tax=Kribbella sp. VKM Ac-2571 TaxID=2512222 RepID=UPI0010621ED1|nr:hypothetical protein [Kribbella sp. VKM Ac-2571]TDO44178.1 hypothetical protein EV651_1392 [Kribbella sp. VKM Ac-2571]